jgi:hypothetical protein
MTEELVQVLRTKAPGIVCSLAIPDKPSGSAQSIILTSSSAIQALDEYLELRNTKEELENKMAVTEKSIVEVNSRYEGKRRDLAYYIDRDLPPKHQAEIRALYTRHTEETRLLKSDYSKLKLAHEQEEKALSQQQSNMRDERITLETRLAEKEAELSKEQLLDLLHRQHVKSKKRKREDEAGGGRQV